MSFSEKLVTWLSELFQWLLKKIKEIFEWIARLQLTLARVMQSL